MRQVTKRLLSLFLVTLLGLLPLLLCACQGSTDPVSPTAEPTGEEEPETVDLSVTRGEEMRNENVSPRQTFTNRQITEQKDNGARIMAEIQAAASDPAQTSYTIPAGIYGFDIKMRVTGTCSNNLPSGFVLTDIDRPDDNPFTIYAEGVTFYFQTPEKPMANSARSLHLINCSNIRFDGLTLDYYNADDIEGAVTRIDTVNNRIAFRLYEGTMKIDDARIKSILQGADCRINAMKPNGDAIVPLYKVSSSWGPGALKISGMESTGEENEYWLTFKENTLLKTIYTTRWESTYGSAGTLEVGDAITLLYGIQYVSIDNCRKIVMENMSIYGNKSGIFENGGYGDHLYRNCYLGPRKGTNQVLGHEGFLTQGLRHGSTYDGLVTDLTTDDSFNIHGFFSKATSISRNQIYFANASVGIQKGDPVEVYTSTGELLGTLTVKETPETRFNQGGWLTTYVTFQEVPDYCKGSGVQFRFPNNECDGWKIINCTIKNCYQRILLQSGSGLMENNVILNMGSTVSIGCTLADYEGGFLGNITIRNNVFYNCTNHPSAAVFYLYAMPEWENVGKDFSLEIYDNVFLHCGKIATVSAFGNLSIHDNLFFSPLVYGVSAVRFSRLENGYGLAKSAEIKNNRLYLTTVEGTHNESGNYTLGITEELQREIDTFAHYSDESAETIVSRIRLALKLKNK